MKSAIPRKPNISDDPTELRRRAEARLSGQRNGRRSKAGDRKSKEDSPRTLHELEVHQVELEMQNTELQKARNELEVALETYIDLYDFAPVGYLTIDRSGVIQAANLTGAALLGVERSRLVNRCLLVFISPASRPIFLTFLKKAFTGPKIQDFEALLLKKGGGTFLAGFQALSAVAHKGSREWCRVAFGDISARKQAEESQRRVETLADTNQGLNREIAQRRLVEESLRKSEQHYAQLLEQSQQMQVQLRHLSHQILHAQEEERKRISRELHDEIAQILVGINVHLAALTHRAAGHPRGFQQKIARTQRLVEKSVDTVHRFARELRPTALDDLGLIPALHTFLKGFKEQTGIQVSLSAFAGVEKLDTAKRTVLFRVAQEALTNVARHAQATRVAASIQKLPGAVRMQIKDNGKSFAVEKVLNGRNHNRLGLLGIRERLEMVGGSFDIASATGEGTTLQVQIPLRRIRADGVR